MEKVLQTFEYAGYYSNQKPYGEPMMSKRNLYPTINDPEETREDLVQIMMRVLNYSDGDYSAIDIAELYDMSVGEMKLAIEQLCRTGLLEPREHTPKYRKNI
ncbi:winged helix-turn-helix domain-containing protein [Halovenus rubra]|uniref:Winged helix-turn-helix domain-containing protein n=1 Tax=Halovenus rubra TaxID=869890 RepID=A0ACC7E2S8_9EURY